jgi:hypothetical protein
MNTHHLRRLVLAAFTALAPATAQAQSPDPEYLVLSGSVRHDGTSGAFLKVHRIAFPSGSFDQASSGPFSVELQDSFGNFLVERRFEANDTSVHSETAPFFLQLPFAAGTARVVLKYGPQALDVRLVSASPPQVRVTFPNGGERLSGRQLVTWTASDADGNDLVFDVLYSTDGGATWSVIITGVVGQSAVFDTDATPGGAQALVRVVASDGVNTGEDTSDAPFSVADKPPQALITSPADATRVFRGWTVILSGHGLDLEDGSIEDAALSWASNRDGFLGTGPEVVRSDLSAGTHEISLVVSDHAGQVTTASITLESVDAEDTDGDQVGDPTDNCPFVHNPEQVDFDQDGSGDLCDDADADGYLDGRDNCRLTPNDQRDSDGDGNGDPCDIVDAGPDQTVECEGAGGTVARLDGSASRDSGGRPLSFRWESPNIVFDNPTAPSARARFPLGSTMVTLTVSNGDLRVVDSATITVNDSVGPDLHAPQAAQAECADPQGTPVSLGSAVSLDRCCEATGSLANDAPERFPLGSTTVTWRAEDCTGNVTMATQDVSVSDTTLPTLVVPPDIMVDCTGRQGTPVSLGSPQVSDGCCGGLVSITNDGPALFPLGTTMVLWSAEDCASNVTFGTQKVTLVDRAAPEVSVEAHPNELWPPNHKMRTVTTTVSVMDRCDAAASFELVSVRSTDPDPRHGRGDREHDVAGAAQGTPDTEFMLRAERSAPHAGRTYTILYRATDSSGNTATASALVRVPRDPHANVP